MDALHGHQLNGRRKRLTKTIQECCEQYWTIPGGNIPQSNSYTATYHQSRKHSKLDEPDMQDTAGEAGTSSYEMFSNGPPYMAEQKQGDQLEPTYEVHRISFQSFFVWAFKIDVDSWKFSMLFLYVLWDGWPIFMISGSKELLQQQLVYTLLKPDCYSWWISKMQSDTLEVR